MSTANGKTNGKENGKEDSQDTMRIDLDKGLVEIRKQCTTCFHFKVCAGIGSLRMPFMNLVKGMGFKESDTRRFLNELASICPHYIRLTEVRLHDSES